MPGPSSATVSPSQVREARQWTIRTIALIGMPSARYSRRISARTKGAAVPARASSARHPGQRGFEEAARQLEEYLAGQREIFDLPLKVR